MSLSDFSDLTDISSDEDDVPLAKSTSKVKKGSKEYKITHVLRPPRTAQYTAKSLYDQIIDNSIDLDPEYQRDVVWQEEKQSGLIDSILRNYYIPPIIFAVTIQDDGSELRTCIDGKQRLTSIQRFIDGQIPHKDSFTNEKLWFKSTASNVGRRKLLPQNLRTQFANKQVVCVEYTELDGDQEREIFQRVQLGVALTPAERLQALVGPWSTVIREIQNQVLGEEGFEGYLDWGHARGRDFQCLATIGYLIENHPKTVIPGPKVLEKWLQKNQPVSARLRADLHDTFRIFVTLARDKKYSGSLNRPTRVSPIEFVMIGVLIYLKRDTLSLTQISSAIEKMRKDVRASHQDIRSNSRITKHLMEFMAKKIKVSELRSDGEGDKPAARAIAKIAQSVKRRRPTYSDDSDEEPVPKAKPTKPSVKSAPAESIKPAKQTSDASDQKANGTKKVVPPLKSGLTSKASTSTRKTNNSMSNLPPAPVTKLSVPTLTTQLSNSRASPPPPPTPNGSSVHPGPIIPNSARPTPTISTGPTVKIESPQMNSLNIPPMLSIADRLAPIRAAKASLAGGNNVEFPVNRENDVRTVPSFGADTPQTSVDPRQNPVVFSHAAPQAAALLTQQVPLAPVPSQQVPTHPGQGRPPIPAKVEEVLRNLRTQFPQLAGSAQNSNDGTLNPLTSGKNAQADGSAGRFMTPPSMPGSGNMGNANSSGHVSQGGGINILQGTYSGNMTNPSADPNQRQPGAYLLPPWPPSHSGVPGNVTSQPHPPPNYPGSSSAGTHTLPQRPIVAPIAPRSSLRAEPLGPRSGSSESTHVDGRRGSYNSYNKDRRYSDDRRPMNRHDRNYDYDRDKRNWSRSRS